MSLTISRLMFFGPGVGTDAGGWYIGPDGKIHRVPGWNPEQMVDLVNAVEGFRRVSQIKAPGVADRLNATLFEVVSKEASQHLNQGDILVVGR